MTTLQKSYICDVCGFDYGENGKKARKCEEKDREILKRFNNAVVSSELIEPCNFPEGYFDMFGIVEGEIKITSHEYKKNEPCSKSLLITVRRAFKCAWQKEPGEDTFVPGSTIINLEVNISKSTLDRYQKIGLPATLSERRTCPLRGQLYLLSRKELERLRKYIMQGFDLLAEKKK